MCRHNYNTYFSLMVRSRSAAANNRNFGNFLQSLVASVPPPKVSLNGYTCEATRVRHFKPFSCNREWKTPTRILISEMTTAAGLLPFGRENRSRCTNHDRYLPKMQQNFSVFLHPTPIFNFASDCDGPPQKNKSDPPKLKVFVEKPVILFLTI